MNNQTSTSPLTPTSPLPRVDGASYRSVVEALGDRVQGTPGQDQAYARCPAHEDRKPSLSVTWREDGAKGGRTFIRCQTGCDARDVLAALGLGFSDLYDTPPARPSGETPRSSRVVQPGPKRREQREKREGAGEPLTRVSTHIYTDANGVPVCEVSKWHGGDMGRSFVTKSFTADGSRIAAKKAPTKDRRDLYNLPAVLAATGTVWLCEGEKDADAMAGVLGDGDAATTMLFGAIATVSGWLPQYTRALTGKSVRIVADRDSAGYHHALLVADVLAGEVASVEVVVPAEGKDAADHLAAGQSVAQLRPATRAGLVTLLDGDDPSPSAGAAVSAEEGAQVLTFPGRRPLSPRRRIVESTQYAEHEGGLYKVETTYDDGTPVDRLTLVLGCSARITRQVLGGLTGVEQADKAAQARLERVEVTATHPKSGETLTLDVEAADWRRGDWMDALWSDIDFKDSRAGRSQVNAAVRSCSPDAERLAEHVATGWRDLPGHGRAYVHAGGAITKDGLVTDVPTRLPGPLANYALPAPPTSPEALAAAAQAHLGLVTDPALPPRVGAVLSGACVRAVLGAAPFVVALVGGEGSGKTALGIVAVQAFGGSRITRESRYGVSMAEGVGATAVASQKWLTLAADAPLLMDDFAPDKGPLAAAQRLGQMIRSAYNAGAGGRDRGTREGGMREGDPPRTLPIVTAEVLPSASSARGRMLLVPPAWDKATLPVEEVRRLQGAQVADARATFTSAVIQWAAGMSERALTECVRDWEAEGTAQLLPLGFAVRTAEHVSRLWAGWRVAIEVMVDGQAWTREDATAFLRGTVWPALVAAAEADTDADEDRDGGKRLLTLVQEALASGDAHLADRGGSAPEGVGAAVSGWTGMVPSGHRIGYVVRDRVYLLPSDALRIAERRATQAGSELGLTVPTASAALDGADVGLRTVMDGTKLRRTPRVRIAGASPRVWDLPLSALTPPEDNCDTTPGGDPSPSAGPDPTPPLPTFSGPTPMSQPVSLAPPEATPEPVTQPEAKESVPGHARSRRERAASLVVEDDEVREALTWAETTGREMTPDEAEAAVERWHTITGCRWSGPHGTIRAVLAGHTRWPGAKTPEPADLGLFEELRQGEKFWTARSWIVTPGACSPSSQVIGADVNAQYVASAGSVEVGEGSPLHYEAGESLPEDVTKMPGWVRLRSAVEEAPHGLDLPAGMWVPTPLAVYLTRDRALTLDIDEALVWERKRTALGSLARTFRDWSSTAKGSDDAAGRTVLAMVKTIYTKALTGYLASRDEALTPPLWRRPDWAALVKAQAEANALRALDRLPAGCTVRAKYADAVYVEQIKGADLSAWDRIDPMQPGRWSGMGPGGALVPVPASAFAKARTPEHWRATYADKAGED